MNSLDKIQSIYYYHLTRWPLIFNVNELLFVTPLDKIKDDEDVSGRNRNEERSCILAKYSYKDRNEDVNEFS